MLSDESFNPPEFVTRKAEVERNSYWFKPELCRHILTVDVNVGRLASVMAREVDLVWSFNPDTRHIQSVAQRT